jgi:hypothetical protein
MQSNHIMCLPGEIESTRAPRAEDRLIQPQVLRAFQPADLDLDDLAEAILRVLDSSDGGGLDSKPQANSDLLCRHNRATHVVGGENL